MTSFKQLQEMKPDAVTEDFLNSIYNSFIKREISAAANQGFHYFTIMGIHACILTINKLIFNKDNQRKQGFKWYLQNFVDGKTTDLKFSDHYNKIYDKRNILAHQFISKLGYSFGFDNRIKEGIKIENGATIINTKIYFNQFHSAFNQNYKTEKSIWDYHHKSLSQADYNNAKQRILTEFVKK